MDKKDIILIKELEKLGLTQIELATFLNITRQSIAKILNHKEEETFNMKSNLENFELIRGKEAKISKKIIEVYLVSLDVF